MRYDKTNPERQEMKDAQLPGEYQPFGDANPNIPRGKSFDPGDGNWGKRSSLNSNGDLSIV